jgi:hypothetical protein
MIETTVNPIGEVQQDETIKQYIQSRVVEWQNVKETIQPKWWQFWKTGTVLCAATKFCIEALDYVIDHVDSIDISNPDKKATALSVMSVFYDYIIREALPIWLKPFAKSIKQILIYSVCSVIIDWIVKKYRDGSWNKSTTGGGDGDQTKTK